MTERSIFSGPVLAVLIAGTTAVFALSILLMMVSSSEQQTANADTHSVSALGHAGLYELVQRLGMPVARSRINSVIAPSEGGVLVMAEPPVYGFSSDDIVRLGRAANVLLILPKRQGSPDPGKPQWIDSSSLIEIESVAGLARLVEPRIDVTRGDPPKAWSTNRIGVQPSFDHGAQLMKSDTLTPIVGGADGMLVGEKRDGSRRIWILSDPDLIENHGLTRGQNAAFAVALLNAMVSGDGNVVFDETIHGMVSTVENPLKKLLQFPYFIVVLLILGGAGVLLWATTSRFGKPRVAPPAFDLGKGRLIATTASLLERAGHHGFVMRRYVGMTLQDVGRLFRAPSGLSDTELAAWLDIIGEARGIEARSAAILAETRRSGEGGQALVGLFQAARDIHKWKEAISNGTSARSSDR